MNDIFEKMVAIIEQDFYDETFLYKALASHQTESPGQTR